MVLEKHAPTKSQKIRRKRNYFTKTVSKRVTGNKDLWNAVKPFLISKDFPHNGNIVINFDNRTITEDKELYKFSMLFYSDVYKILSVLPLFR